MKSKMGRPRGAPVRHDLDAPAARRWWSLDLTTGRLTWCQSPGGGVLAGAVAGRTVSLGGQKYRANRVAFLVATGAWPLAGRVPTDTGAALAGRRVHYAVPSPQDRMLRLIRAIVASDPAAWQGRF